MMDYTDLTTLSQLSKIDAELAEILKGYVPPPIPPENPDYAAMRLQVLEDERRRADASRPPGVKESTKSILMRDGYESELRILEPLHRSAEKDQGTPIFVLYYGGGFMHGNNYQLSAYGNALVMLYGAIVVLPNYRLTPENPFPIGVNDSWDSLVWIAANAATLGAQTSAGFVVGGVSAGANISAVITQKAIAEGLSPAPTGLWLNIPVVLATDIIPARERHLWVSRDTNADAPGFNSTMNDHFLRAYKADTKSPLMSPYNSKNAHLGMPPTYFQVAGLDPLRDDGLIYERNLRENGVSTLMDVYPGVPHGHFVFFPQLELSLKSNVDSIVGLGWLIGKKVDREMVVQSVTPPASA